jgi:hypothetical protein
MYLVAGYSGLFLGTLMRTIKAIGHIIITCSIFVGMPAMASLSSIFTRAQIAIPADVIAKLRTNSASSAPVERLEIRPATTNTVVLPAGTNLMVTASGTNLAIFSSATDVGSPSTNLMTIPRGIDFVMVSTNTDVTNIPSGTNSVVVVPGTNNAVQLQPGTNVVIVPSTTNLISTSTNTAEAIGGTNLIAYMQLQSEDETKSEFGQSFGQAFYVGEVTVQNTNGFTVLVYSSSLQVRVKYFIHHSDLNRIPKEQRDLIPPGAFLPGKRRPATFSDILSIFDYQQKKNWKQRTVDVIKSAGQVAAGATVFVSGATYPKAVSFVTGIINPELEKHLLWDLLLHAKNLESRSFKEIEEIPAYKPITKLVFFPKAGIPGIILEKLVYLSDFPVSDEVEVQGALLKDQQGIQSRSLNTQ